MRRPKYLHHDCAGCKFITHHDGYDMYHCDQPGDPNSGPILVAIRDDETGRRKQTTCISESDARTKPLFFHALVLANDRGWFLKDQASHIGTESSSTFERTSDLELQ